MRTIKYPDGITEWQNPLRAYPQRGDLLQGIHDLLFKITDFSTVIPWAVMILTKLMVVPHYSKESSLIPTYGIFVNFPLVLMGCTKWGGDHFIYKIKTPTTVQFNIYLTEYFQNWSSFSFSTCGNFCLGQQSIGIYSIHAFVLLCPSLKTASLWMDLFSNICCDVAN